jgi:hypothetical protein
MSKAAPFVGLAVSMLAACAPGSAPPSLLPRAAEKIDPRVPVVRPMNDRPVDPQLQARLDGLLGQALAGDTMFDQAIVQAERLAPSAGAAESESWIAAQQALSAAVAAREPTARALGDIDALGGDKLHAAGGLAPADLAAIAEAGAKVAAIDQAQADRLAAVQRRLMR